MTITHHYVLTLVDKDRELGMTLSVTSTTPFDGRLRGGLRDVLKGASAETTARITKLLRPKKVLTPEQIAKAERKAAREAKRFEVEKTRADRSAARAAKQAAALKKGLDKERKRQEREAKKQELADRRAQREWLKAPPQDGDFVEYQEKAGGRRRTGKCIGATRMPGGDLRLRIAGERGQRFYPETQVRRALPKGERR